MKQYIINAAWEIYFFFNLFLFIHFAALGLSCST